MNLESATARCTIKVFSQTHTLTELERIIGVAPDGTYTDENVINNKKQNDGLYIKDFFVFDKRFELYIKTTIFKFIKTNIINSFDKTHIKNLEIDILWTFFNSDNINNNITLEPEILEFLLNHKITLSINF